MPNIEILCSFAGVDGGQYKKKISLSYVIYVFGDEI